MIADAFDDEYFAPDLLGLPAVAPAVAGSVAAGSVATDSGSIAVKEMAGRDDHRVTGAEYDPNAVAEEKSDANAEEDSEADA